MLLRFAPELEQMSGIDSNSLPNSPPNSPLGARPVRHFGCSHGDRANHGRAILNNNSLSLAIMISGNFPSVSHLDWIDRLNPRVVRLDTGFGMRWYGLAYLAGFLLTGWILLRWARKGRLSIKEGQVPTFVLYSALGVMIGGRLGYCLLYEAHNIFHQPLVIFALWHGGMASHGLIAGLIIVLWAFACQRGLSALPLLGAAAATLPPGIANFIKGELWARPTGVPWAVNCPHAPLVNGVQVLPHPRPLYAADGEGFLVFLVIQWIYCRSSRVGLTTGVVSIAYGNWTIH